MSLCRQSQVIISRAAYICRAASTTNTSGGGTKVQSSGASANLSQASRSADGTDMAMRDAEQRTTSTDPTKSKPTGGSSQTPPVGKSSTPWGTIGLGIVLVIGSYYVYTNYVKKSPEVSKILNANKNTREQQSTGRDESGGKKH
ncbi:hypothetical protein I4U23_003273 [Adineta vaga]|nr:hypothetical protein I4U23_003273 [Adineta vaga]